jgi:hypothetical protein
MTMTTQIFKSKQVTMVRKCQKMSKELPRSAQPPRAQDQNVILPTYKKRSRQQHPPAHRHRSVLTLDHVVPLFEMRDKSIQQLTAQQSRHREGKQGR